MTVTEIDSKDKYDAAFQESRLKLILIDFYAVWCGPCKLMDPEVRKIAEDFSDDVSVYKCNVDDCPEISTEATISCMPTFHILKNGEKVEELQGANKEKLRDLIQKHIRP